MSEMPPNPESLKALDEQMEELAKSPDEVYHDKALAMWFKKGVSDPSEAEVMYAARELVGNDLHTLRIIKDKSKDRSTLE